MSKFIRLALLIALVVGLTDCGQKGPLRRPEAANLAVSVAAAESQVR